MFETIVLVLIILWILGLLANIGGALIHVLIVAALVVIVIRLVSGRNA